MIQQRTVELNAFLNELLSHDDKAIREVRQKEQPYYSCKRVVVWWRAQVCAHHAPAGWCAPPRPSTSPSDAGNRTAPTNNIWQHLRI